MTRTLPEDLLPIICDHYATTRQLRALATISLLNHRISGYARTRLFKQFEFIDDRSSRVLEHANTLCQVYEDGELLDEDILAIVDSKEIDPLELDPELRWLKGMRMCETIIIKDLLYGRDIESIITLSTSLSERKLVLFPKVNKLVIGGKLVKRILATEQRGPRPKITPLNLLIAMFHATRPKILDIQDSAIFTPPPTGLIRMTAHQGQVGGRTIPSRGGHMSHTIIQFIESMDSIQEIRYHAVNPDIPIYPKKGIHHVVYIIPDPHPEADIRSFGGPISHKEKIIKEIKDIITRSIVGRYEMMQEIGTFGHSGGGGGGGTGGTVGQRVGGVGSFGGGGTGLFGTGTGAGNGSGLFGQGGTNGQTLAITHAHAPSVGTQPQSPFGTQMSMGIWSIPPITASSDVGPSTDTNGNTAVTATGPGPSTNSIPGPFTSTATVNAVPATSTNAVAGPSSHLRSNSWDNQSAYSDGNTDVDDSEAGNDPPIYTASVNVFGHGLPTTNVNINPSTTDPAPVYTNNKQSSWHFVLPSQAEMESIRRQIVFWAERIKGNVGDEVRARINFGVIGQKGCDWEI